MKKAEFNSVTRFLFVTTQIAAIFWVTVSYGIAVYSTIFLGIPYPVESLSTQAILTILGSSTLKVVGNIFEHNDGKAFGKSHSSEEKEGDTYDRI